MSVLQHYLKSSLQKLYLALTLVFVLNLSVSVVKCENVLPQNHQQDIKTDNQALKENVQVQSYYLSEQEYKLIDLDDIYLDYQFKNTIDTNCNKEYVEIITSQNEKLVQYYENTINTPVINIITFASQKMLKVNAVGLLSNTTLITFIDDASSFDTETDKTSTHLKNIQAYPIANQDSCENLKKASSDSFIFECSKFDNNKQVNVITLYKFNSKDFSNANGIDLSNIQPQQITLNFDPKFAFKSKSPDQSPQQLEASYQLFLQEYQNCVKDTGFYFNSDTNVQHYFRTCKYHETLMQTNSDQQIYLDNIVSFFEFYDLSIVQSDGSVTGKSPTIKFKDENKDLTIKTQGVQQAIDNCITVLDYDNGLLFFIYDNISNQYQNQDYFVKYYYDQKYINLFIQKNKDIEFSIQDSIPNYMVVNTQMYILMYQLNSSSQVGINTFPQTVSISRFVNSVQTIHIENKEDGDKHKSEQDKTDFVIPDIKNVSNFRSIKYNFDQYLYYIEIKFSDPSHVSYFLMVNRALTDNTNSIKMNQTAIELEQLTQNNYSKIFHYFIPGLFYSNIRTRVRLFQIGEDTGSIILKKYSDDQISQAKNNLSITTYSWKSAQIMKLYTKQFETYSSCSITMHFEAKPSSQAVGTKIVQGMINLIPRNFNGVISKVGLNIQKKFFNPKPIFEIKDWFFGAGINYSYQSKQDVTLAIKYNSSTIIQEIDSIQDKQKVLLEEQENKSTLNLDENICKLSPCDEKVIAAIQVGEDYYIFYQNCLCLFWFEKCTVQTPTGLSQNTPACQKSKSMKISQKIESIIFDGSKILALGKSLLANSNTLQQSPSLTLMNVYDELSTEGDDSGGKKNPYATDTNLKNSTLPQNQCDAPQFSNFLQQGPKQSNQKKIHIKKNLQTEQNDSQQGKPINSGQFRRKAFTPPKNLNLNLNFSLDKIQFVFIYCIPNTIKYALIVQSQLFKIKSMVIFSIQNQIQDVSIYTFQDTDQLQDSYDVSLLDQGIIFAAHNQQDNVPGRITIYRVNFISQQITVDRYFTKQDMLHQIQQFQQNIFTGQFSKQNSQNKIKTSELNDDVKFQVYLKEMKQKNIVYVNDFDNFMNNFSVKVWRNDDKQTYRFLLIDFQNNCLFDYFLYDLIQPIFIRQVNLYDFQIITNQQFQITNNMISLHVTKKNLDYLISLEINGQSINQIRKIELQQDKQVRSFSQVQQSLGNPYQEGTLCGVFQLPSPSIKCIFYPQIELNFDYSLNSKQNQDQKTNQVNQDGYQTSSDKQVDFSIYLSTDLNPEQTQITLQTDFSNFDTNLIQEDKSPIYYDAQNNSTVLENDGKNIKLKLNTTFVKGSIGEYYLQPLNKQNVKVKAYIDTDQIQNQSLSMISSPSYWYIKQTVRNPYQIVYLLDSQLLVINQNMKYEFKEIFRIKYTDIEIKQNLKLEAKLPDNLKLCDCSEIYSNSILSSQTTTTYLYILLCNYDSKNKIYITFNVDINHYSSLEDQQKDWEIAMKNNVRYVDINFIEEDLDSMVSQSQIKNIQIISLTDDLNNLTGFIFMLVRYLSGDPNDVKAQHDNTIYILWSSHDPYSTYFQMYEIEQINSADFGLNYISVYNFVASFPQHYPNQARLVIEENQSKQVIKDFIFNIGWDDGERYVILALLKLSLPPIQQNESSTKQSTGNAKLVFNAYYEDIYSDLFNSFIKSYQTYLQPFTHLRSQITFQPNTYDSSVIIINEFSILEFTTFQSEDPYAIIKKKDAKNISSKQLWHDSDFKDSDNISKIITYSQYAWCNNYFNNNQQTILKYHNFFIIMCAQINKPSINSTIPDRNSTIQSILKVYKIHQNSDDGEDGDDSDDSDGKLFKNKANKKILKGKTTLVSNQTVSMVQSINYTNGSNPTIALSSMSFRQENQDLYFDIILSQDGNFKLFEYPVNDQPYLIVKSDISDKSSVEVCTNNKYMIPVCNQAIFVNPIIDTNDQSMKEWLKFTGLVALPLFLTLSFIFVSFIFMKKLRKNRQDEFIQLLQNQSTPYYKSKSDLSFVDSVSNQQKNEKFLTSFQPQVKNPIYSVSEHALFTFNDNQLNASTELK
ncbi:transmembrane protein, putative (macronuclear) [Tetrahymena thermophila SB210]|uniref:Transmembrane protein, putative n=1 Tax=Tetrahymena thermophila (strain SB210) TaxID=312017 RepID=Q22RR6_TETTS|nr:transmembrane protein, putative [Tetrahymena thermophila SB210]EAR88056.2 transmembrane protein, putative [Tetrahymena thermophila SB210]|eukprot:XP_001008301.2 transmembrane protein, putative [Tetrahymena thermophila SB210]